MILKDLFHINAKSATEFTENKTIELTGDVIGTSSSKTDWSINTTLKNSGVTAGRYGHANEDSSNGIVTIPYIEVNSKGLITSITNKNIRVKTGNDGPTITTGQVISINTVESVIDSPGVFEHLREDDSNIKGTEIYNLYESITETANDIEVTYKNEANTNYSTVCGFNNKDLYDWVNFTGQRDRIKNANLISGTSNTLNNSSNNIVSGGGNTITSSVNSIISGSGKTANNINSSILTGDHGNATLASLLSSILVLSGDIESTGSILYSNLNITNQSPSKITFGNTVINSDLNLFNNAAKTSTSNGETTYDPIVLSSGIIMNSDIHMYGNLSKINNIKYAYDSYLSFQSGTQVSNFGFNSSIVNTASNSALVSESNDSNINSSNISLYNSLLRTNYTYSSILNLSRSNLDSAPIHYSTLLGTNINSSTGQYIASILCGQSFNILKYQNANNMVTTCAIFGEGHKLAGSLQGNLVAGRYNILCNTYDNLVAGASNKIVGGYYNNILGYNNVLAGNSSLMVGTGNIFTNSSDNNYNDPTDSYSYTAAYGSLIYGNNNKNTGSTMEWSLVGGTSNTLSGGGVFRSSIFIGSQGTLSGRVDYSIISLTNATLPGEISGSLVALGYGTYAASAISRSIVVGSSFNLGGGSYYQSAIFGSGHKINVGAYASLLAGSNFTIQADEASIDQTAIFGSNHTIINDSDYSIIGGNRHIIGKCKYSIVSGSDHTLPGDSEYNAIFGQGNYVTNYLCHSLISGNQNKINSNHNYYDLIFGQSVVTNSSATLTASLIGGQSLNVNGNSMTSLIIGSSATFSDHVSYSLLNISNSTLSGFFDHSVGFVHGSTTSATSEGSILGIISSHTTRKIDDSILLCYNDNSGGIVNSSIGILYNTTSNSCDLDHSNIYLNGTHSLSYILASIMMSQNALILPIVENEGTENEVVHKGKIKNTILSAYEYKVNLSSTINNSIIKINNVELDDIAEDISNSNILLNAKYEYLYTPSSGDPYTKVGSSHINFNDEINGSNILINNASKSKLSFNNKVIHSDINIYNSGEPSETENETITYLPIVFSSGEIRNSEIHAYGDLSNCTFNEITDSFVSLNTVNDDDILTINDVSLKGSVLKFYSDIKRFSSDSAHNMTLSNCDIRNSFIFTENSSFAFNGGSSINNYIWNSLIFGNELNFVTTSGIGQSIIAATNLESINTRYYGSAIFGSGHKFGKSTINDTYLAANLIAGTRHTVYGGMPERNIIGGENNTIGGSYCNLVTGSGNGIYNSSWSNAVLGDACHIGGRFSLVSGKSNNFYNATTPDSSSNSALHACLIYGSDNTNKTSDGSGFMMYTLLGGSNIHVNDGYIEFSNVAGSDSTFTGNLQNDLIMTHNGSVSGNIQDNIGLINQGNVTKTCIGSIFGNVSGSLGASYDSIRFNYGGNCEDSNINSSILFTGNGTQNISSYQSIAMLQNGNNTVSFNNSSAITYYSSINKGTKLNSKNEEVQTSGNFDNTSDYRAYYSILNFGSTIKNSRLSLNYAKVKNLITGINHSDVKIVAGKDSLNQWGYINTTATDVDIKDEINYSNIIAASKTNSVLTFNNKIKSSDIHIFSDTELIENVEGTDTSMPIVFNNGEIINSYINAYGNLSKVKNLTVSDSDIYINSILGGFESTVKSSNINLNGRISTTGDITNSNINILTTDDAELTGTAGNIVISGDIDNSNISIEDVIENDSYTISGDIESTLLYGKKFNISANVSESVIVGNSITINSAKSNSVYIGEDLTSTSSSTEVIIGNNNNNDKSGNLLVVANNGNKFEVDNSGNTNATTFNATGNNYAIYRQWNDNNTNEEDRSGKFVALHTDGTIKIANATDKIYGITTNEVGFTVGGNELSILGTGESYKSVDQAYIKVAILGDAIIEDDGTCVVGNFAASNATGIATNSTTSTGYQVIARIDSTHVKVTTVQNTESTSSSSSSSTTTSQVLTLASNGWSNNSQTVAIELDTNKLNTIIITLGENSDWAAFGVNPSAETSSGITFSCTSVPNKNLTFRVVSMSIN